MVNATPGPTTSAAPLAQLREVEPEAWDVLMAQGGHTDDPATATALQSLAAHMLGDHELARKIRRLGFYATHAGHVGAWPDLVSSYPTIESTPETIRVRWQRTEEFEADVPADQWREDGGDIDFLGDYEDDDHFIGCTERTVMEFHDPKEGS